MADTTAATVLPPLKMVDNGDTPTTYSLAVFATGGVGSLGATAWVVASDATELERLFGAVLQAAGQNVWVCDGTADDVQIQAASDVILAAGSGKLGLVGKTFVTSAAVTYPANITFEGDGIGLTTMQVVAGGTHTMLVNASGVVTAGNGEDNVTIRGITFDVNGQACSSAIDNYGGVGFVVEDVEVKDVAFGAGTAGYGIYAQDTDDITYRRVRATNIAQRDGLQFKGCQRVWLYNIKVDNATLYGVDMHASTTPRDMADVHIDGLQVLNSGFAVSVQDGSHWHLAGVRGYNCGVGIDIRNDTVDVNIYDPMLDTITADPAINTYYATTIDGLKIHGGYIKTVNGTTKDGVYIGPNSGAKTAKDILIDGLTIDGCTREGLRVATAGGGAITDLRIRDIRAINNTNSGIRVIDTDDVQVRGGTSTGNDVGITIDNSDDMLIDGLDVETNTTLLVNVANGSVGMKYRDMHGWKTENSGTATLLNGQTTITVAHGLAATPSVVFITFAENPTNVIADWWVDTLGAVNFVFNGVDPGASNLDFYWYAKV